MKEDLPAAVRAIAKFIDVELDAELEKIVLEQSSIEFMRAHVEHFDDHLIRQTRDNACGLPPGGEASKVRSGRVGDHATELDSQVLDELDQIWKRSVETKTGLATYAALRPLHR